MVGCPSVRPSVCTIDRQQQRRAANLLLSSDACSRYRSTGSSIDSRRRPSCGCGQRHVESRGTRLNTGLFLLFDFRFIPMYTRKKRSSLRFIVSMGLRQIVSVHKINTKWVHIKITGQSRGSRLRSYCVRVTYLILRCNEHCQSQTPLPLRVVTSLNRIRPNVNTLRHLQNRKYITYRIVVKGGPKYGHRLPVK